MFDLEQAIAGWRRKLLDGGIWVPGVLDELESHLRDDVDALLRTGINEQQAFETAAVARIGSVKTLESELNRMYKLKRAGLVACMTVYFLVSAIPLLFNLGTYKYLDATQQRSVLAAVVITCIALFVGLRLGRILPPVSRRMLLAVAGASATLFLVWLVAFYHHVMTRVEWDLSQLVVAVVWVFMPIGFASVFLGMEEATFGRTPKTHV